MISSSGDDDQTATTPTTIKAARARRQSLRSYLQNVSLSDAIIPQTQEQQSDNVEAGSNTNTSSSSISTSNKQPNRRRRLEVMGLLQHLKIHRYEDTATSSSLNGHNSSSDWNNHHSISVGSLENDDKFTNDTTSGVDNTAPTTTGEINQTPPTTLSNTTAAAVVVVVEQKCLLHPTVRLRNDKCSLCCALAKTLEVRRAKEQKINNLKKKNAAVASHDVSVGSAGGITSSEGGEKNNVVDGAHEDYINRRGDGYDNENKHGSISDCGGGKEDDGDDNNRNKRSVLLEEDDTEKKGRVASRGGLSEETIVVTTISKSSIANATESVGEDEDGLQGEHDNSHHLKSLLEEKEMHARDAKQLEETSSSTIVAATKTIRDVEAPSTPIRHNNDDQVPQSSTLDRGEPQYNLIDNPTASTPTKVSERSLPNENYLGATTLSMTTPATSLNDDDDDHGGDSNCSSKETPPITTSSSTTTVPLTKLQRTIALAKGALLDSNKSRQQRDGQASSTVVKRRSDIVVDRSLPSYESLRSDSQPPLSSQEKVVVPTTNSTASFSDTSAKSTSDSPPLTSSTVEDNGRESNASGRNLGATRLPSKIIGDDEDNIDSKPCKEGDDGEDSFGSTCDDKPVGEDLQVAVPPPTHATVVSSKSSITVTGSDPKNRAAVQTNIIVEDVDSDSDKEDECWYVPSSTKTVEMQSRPKAVDDTTKSNEQQEGNDEERIHSETDATSVGTAEREKLDKKEDSAIEQTSSTTSVIQGPSTTLQNDTAEEGTVDSTAASREERNKARQDSSHTDSASSTGEDSRDKQQKQFSEVERRLSRANQRLSRSITQRDNTKKRRSRSRTRSVDSKGFFAALVENARSRSSSRTRQRSRSRSATRKGDENTSKAEKELDTRQRSRSKSVTRKGGDGASKEGETRKLSRSQSVKRNGGSESINNKQEKRRSRSSSRSAAKKDGSTRERSRSTARKGVENTRAEEIKNAGGNRSRSVSKARKNMEANKREEVIIAKDEEDCSEATASEVKSTNDNKDLPIKDISSSSRRPNQVSSEPSKIIHLPDPHGMTVKALKAELNMFKVDYSSFNEKEQFISAVRHSRETSQRPQFEITSMKLKALKEELAIYDVDYSSFREKSEFMEALRDAREAAKPEGAPQRGAVSPQEDITGENTKELNLNVNYREPITHPRYKLGDTGRDEDMIILPVTSRSRSGRGRRKRDQDSSEASSADEDQDDSDQSKIIASVMELQHLDAAFIRRSDGRWTYALVVNGDNEGIRFVLNQQGSTKMLAKEKWKKNVRRIKVLTQRKGDVLKVNDKPPRRRRGKSISRRSISKTRRRGRLASPSPTRFYRYRRVDTLKLPPTITEGEVFVSKGMDMVPKAGLKRQRMYSQASTDVLPAHLRKEDI